jgi:hypothetical protein
MTIALTQPASRDLPGAFEELSPERLAKANINPATRLATDYLNHFNEAIMLLDLVSSVPECLPDFMAWQPMTYPEHFAASNFKDRELALSAYEVADPAARRQLGDVADAMTAILLATRDAMMAEGCSVDGAAGAAGAAEAVAQLRPLVERAGAVINGKSPPRILVDALFDC